MEFNSRTASQKPLRKTITQREIKRIRGILAEIAERLEMVSDILEQFKYK